MFKKWNGFSRVLFLLIFILISCSQSMPDDVKITDEMGEHFVTFITSDNNKTFLNIHNELNDNINFKHFLGNTDHVYYASIGVSDNINVVAIARNDLKLFGYDIYKIDTNAIKKIGFIEGGLGDLIIIDNILYVIQYTHDAKIFLKSYLVDDLNEQLDTFEIPGDDVSRLIYTETQESLLITSFGSEGTHLTTIKENDISTVNLFSDPYETSLLATDKGLLLSQGQGIDDSMSNKNKVYTLDEHGLKELIQTKSSPLEGIYNDGQIFILSGNVNHPTIEIYDIANKNRLAVLNVDEEVWGVVPLGSDVYIYTLSHIYKIQNLELEKVLTHENNPLSPLHLNIFNY